MNVEILHSSLKYVYYLTDAGADPVRKFRGGRFQKYLAAKIQLAVKCLSELYKIMVKNVTFVGFRGDDRPPCIRPCTDVPK